MRVKIFTNSPGMDIKRYINTIEDTDYIIATDKEALELIKANVRIDLSIGDFDSVNEEEYELIKSHSKNTITLSKVKDETDTKAAVEFAKSLGASEIIIYAKATGRFDHFFAIVTLLGKTVSLVDYYNKLYILRPGTHKVNPIHSYVSFYAMEAVENLSLKGFKYELNSYNLLVGDSKTTSNEGSGEVSFTKGKLLVIESSDE